jgi:hypothetical protein
LNQVAELHVPVSKTTSPPNLTSRLSFFGAKQSTIVMAAFPVAKIAIQAQVNSLPQINVTASMDREKLPCV